jgi:ATP-dependent Clp protease ATP-binding subunit ClpA
MTSNIRADSQLREFFRPEFLNRLDEVITYNALEPDQIRAIVDVQLARLAKHLREQEIELELTGAAKEALAKEGYDPEFGARPLKRVIQKRIQNLLADAILRGTLGPGSRASIDFRAGKFELAIKQPEPEHAAAG